jgi:hypothetical protein
MSIIFSDLTPYDRAVLEPSLHFFFDQNNCDRKVDTLIKRAQMSREDALERTKQSCDAQESLGRPVGSTEDFDYWRCPCRIVDRSLASLVSIAMLLKKGILPFEGGYFDQPANLMGALNIVQSFMSEHEEKERKKQEAAARAKKGKR